MNIEEIINDREYSFYIPIVYKVTMLIKSKLFLLIKRGQTVAI